MENLKAHTRTTSRKEHRKQVAPYPQGQALYQQRKLEKKDIDSKLADISDTASELFTADAQSQQPNPFSSVCIAKTREIMNQEEVHPLGKDLERHYKGNDCASFTSRVMEHLRTGKLMGRRNCNILGYQQFEGSVQFMVPIHICTELLSVRNELYDMHKLLADPKSYLQEHIEEITKEGDLSIGNRGMLVNIQAALQLFSASFLAEICNSSNCTLLLPGNPVVQEGWGFTSVYDYLALTFTPDSAHEVLSSILQLNQIIDSILKKDVNKANAQCESFPGKENIVGSTSDVKKMTQEEAYELLRNVFLKWRSPLHNTQDLFSALESASNSTMLATIAEAFTRLSS